jgi:polysaccharide pyruvyl transferase CsaB
VRDQASSDLLNTWHIEHVLAPDPVWALAGIPLAQNLDDPRPRIAVNLRSHPTLTTERIARLTTALKALQRELHATVVFVPFQKSQDQAIAEQLYQDLAQPKMIAEIAQPQQFKTLFSQVDFLIGMRLHSLIIAASAGCPCFALSYDPKVTQLQQQCQIPGWLLDDLPEDTEMITEEWRHCFTNGQGFATQQQMEIQQAVDQHRDLLTKLSH